jgi:hypothetical protein
MRIGIGGRKVETIPEEIKPCAEVPSEVRFDEGLKGEVQGEEEEQPVQRTEPDVRSER